MGARILVVDDEANHRVSLAIGLRLEGFEVEVAGDGREALEVMARSSVAVAVVDLMMPGMNGLQFARHLRGHGPGVKIVLTSAYHLTDRQIERADAGIAAFVPKPYAVEELVRVIRGLLSPAEPWVLSRVP